MLSVEQSERKPTEWKNEKEGKEKQKKIENNKTWGRVFLTDKWVQAPDQDPLHFPLHCDWQLDYCLYS